jgi:hypothetical protein
MDAPLAVKTMNASTTNSELDSVINLALYSKHGLLLLYYHTPLSLFP